MMTDKMLGYAMIPMDDFDTDVELERSYPLQYQAVDKGGNGPIMLSTTMITVNDCARAVSLSCNVQCVLFASDYSFNNVDAILPHTL